MATEAQIAANRENAKRSTGPRTESGKQASRLNALKTGIHAPSHVAEFHPTSARQRNLVDTAAQRQTNAANQSRDRKGAVAEAARFTKRFPISAKFEREAL